VSSFRINFEYLITLNTISSIYMCRSISFASIIRMVWKLSDKKNVLLLLRPVRPPLWGYEFGLQFLPSTNPNIFLWISIQAELEENLRKAHAELALLKIQSEHVRAPASRRGLPGDNTETQLNPPAKKLRLEQPSTPSSTASSARGAVQPQAGHCGMWLLQSLSFQWKL